MKLATPIILLIFIYSVQALAVKNFAQEQWNTFKITYNKNYANSKEEQFRKELFLKNLEHIEQHNEKFHKGLVTYKLGINQFSDFTNEELLSYSPVLKMPLSYPQTVFKSKNQQLPDTVDWREKGFSPIKDQGDCGSCWAFSTTGALEYHFSIYQNLNLSLSEQQLIDCVYDSEGCMGGYVEYAYLYIKHNLGINIESDYPYEEKDGSSCRFNRKKEHYNITGLVKIEAGSEEDLQKAVAEKGPVSIAVNTFGNFYLYESGVYYSEDCDNDILNHAMVVVGYGTEDGEDYWLVKNSFSENWGEHGYIKMARNRDNNCGIANSAMFPVLQKSKNSNCKILTL